MLIETLAVKMVEGICLKIGVDQTSGVISWLGSDKDVVKLFQAICKLAL